MPIRSEARGSARLGARTPIALIPLVLGSLSACKSGATALGSDSDARGSSPAPSMGRVISEQLRPTVLRPGVVILDEAVVGPIQVLENSLVLHGDRLDLGTVPTGTVVAGVTADGNGFLRTVVAVQTTGAPTASTSSVRTKGIGNLITIITHPASLLDAIRDGEYRWTLASTPRNGDLSGVSTDWGTQLTIDAKWNLTPNVVVHVDIVDGQLANLGVDARADAGLVIDETLAVGGMWSKNWRKTILPDTVLAEGPLELGPLPVYAKLSVSMDAVGAANASSRASVTLTKSCTATFGGDASYSPATGWTFADETAHDCATANLKNADLDVSASVSVGLAPTLKVTFDSVLTPSVSADLSLVGSVDVCPPPSKWDVSLKTDASVGVGVSFFGLTKDFSQKLPEATIPITHGFLPTPSFCADDAGSDASDGAVDATSGDAMVSDASVIDGSTDSTSCAAGTSNCFGKCVDTQNNVENCGACGHSCSGACAEGKCQAWGGTYTCPSETGSMGLVFNAKPIMDSCAMTIATISVYSPKIAGGFDFDLYKNAGTYDAPSLSATCTTFPSATTTLTTKYQLDATGGDTLTGTMRIDVSRSCTTSPCFWDPSMSWPCVSQLTSIKLTRAP